MHYSFNSGPSSSPSVIKIKEITRKRATVIWNQLPCYHRNGQITGYKIQLYMEKCENESLKLLEEVVNNQYVTSYHLRSLTPNTDYCVQLAVVNAAGVGPHSEPIHFSTRGRKPCTYYTCKRKWREIVNLFKVVCFKLHFFHMIMVYQCGQS